jgi:hypothetical protein
LKKVRQKLWLPIYFSENYPKFAIDPMAKIQGHPDNYILRLAQQLGKLIKLYSVFNVEYELIQSYLS